MRGKKKALDARAARKALYLDISSRRASTNTPCEFGDREEEKARKEPTAIPTLGIFRIYGPGWGVVKLRCYPLRRSNGCPDVIGREEGCPKEKWEGRGQLFQESG